MDSRQYRAKYLLYKNSLFNVMGNVYYVYMYYLKSTGEVFYVGKGKNDRYKSMVHRNALFLNILNKHKDDVDVKFYKEHLSEDESFEIEKQLIKEYWDKGECRANFHEGGNGGNTGNYTSPERSRKLSEFAKTRVGEKNPMWGKTHTPEVRKLLSEINKGKPMLQHVKEKLIAANTGRKKSEYEIEVCRRNGLIGAQKMKSHGETYRKMMESLCQYKYVVYLNGEKQFECLGHTELEKYCNEHLKMSRTIMWQVVHKTGWKPKFNKHKHLETLEIIRIDRSVSTNRDECSDVG